MFKGNQILEDLQNVKLSLRMLFNIVDETKNLKIKILEEIEKANSKLDLLIPQPKMPRGRPRKVVDNG